VTDVAIEQAGTDRIPDLEPLWAALQEHHAELEDVPQLRSLEESWRRRSAQYERWLGAGSGQLYVALREGRAVGYAMVRIGHGPPTWAVDDHVAEVETLAVLAGERSSGVGAALLDAALDMIERSGIRAVGVAVVHSNADAIRFYERAGFRPFYVQLLRVK
jgi:ribosomal protein S18 acetylase RimI-like enzyme